MDDSRPAHVLRTSFCAALRRMLHRIIGAPDYATYLEHVRRRHPGVTPLSENEFFQQRLADRYSRLGSRCC